MPIELNDLIKDARLSRLFTTSGRACALQIWIAQIQTEDGFENRFVYGRLLPYSYASAEWNASSDDKLEAVGDCRAQVIRATLYFDSALADKLLNKLIQGEDIKTVSQQLGLKLSDSLKKRIGTFSLNDNYAYRPAAFLLNRDAHERAGPQSPHGSASAFSAAITTLDKEKLFSTVKGRDSEMARFLVKRMNDSTGLDFANKDATRFGDLELLVFPTLDDYERELLDVSWGDERNTLAIRLRLNQLQGFSKFLVHAKITNDDQCVFSSILPADRKRQDMIECNFDLPKRLGDISDSAEVEIYGMTNEHTAATLCCRWKIYYIREISISGIAIGGSSAEVKLGWLDRALKKHLRGSTRVKAAQSVNRGDRGFSSLVGGRQEDPWVAANRKISKLLDVIHPPKSEARFFGRLSEGDGTERLQFVEWIKVQFSKHKNHQIIFFDPYFEDAGIGLFFPNASENGEYIVFTAAPRSANTKAIDSVEDPDDRRIENLLASCKKLKPLGRRIDLRIYGLKPGALHDRYMLIVDRDGLPVSGFNLSNSIQKANENHPLLITPIPMDALHDVVNYATRLISRAANRTSTKGEEIEPIFDSKLQDQPVRIAVERLSFLRLDLAGTVLAIWTGTDSLRDLHSECLRSKLNELGLLKGESLRISNSPGFKACVASLVANEASSHNLWKIIAEVLAHTPYGDAPLNATEEHNNELINFLEIFLNTAFSRISDVGPEISFESVQPQLFQQNLEIFLRGSYSHEHFRYRTRYQKLTWADAYAIKILWHLAPEKLVKLSEQHAAVLDNEHHRDAIKLSLLSQIIGEISLTIAFGIGDRQKESLLQSSNGLLKWMGLASLREESKTEDGAKRVTERLASFDRETSIRTLCWLLSGLPWEQNFEASISTIQQALYEKLSPKLKKEEAEFLVNGLRGHMRELGWSEPWLFSGVIVPLLDEGRLTPELLSNIWMKELFSYLDQKLLGKTVIFKREREGRTTEIAAFLLSQSTFETQTDAIATLLKTLKKVRGNVQQPLASTLNWNTWNCSLEVAMWIYAFCRHLEHYKEDSTILPSQFADLCAPSRELALIRTVEEWRNRGGATDAFAAFIEEVGEI
ncbi:VPA1262 family protein [Pseudomonas monteilii]|uniref:VPA1262 family protein n=1 Tax=Pseudomonas monteilii TaxID=76759 RepID=UPI003CFEBF72